MFNFDAYMLLPVFGGAFIIAWTMGIFWNWRSWYWRSQRSVYSYLPIGLLFILASFEQKILASGWIDPWLLRVIYFLFIAVAVWWTVRTPHFLRPWWAKEIESRRPALYKALQKETKRDKTWKSHFQNRDTLSRWLDQIEKSVKKARK